MPAVLWICGAPGVGKTTVAWALFEQLAEAGTPVGYLDIDQVGMLYPAASEDPERHRLKEEALQALRPAYRRAGADLLVVSGVVDPGLTQESVQRLGAVHHCLLTAEPATLRARVLARGWDAADADEAVAEQTVPVRDGWVDSVVDTSGLDVTAVVTRVPVREVALAAPGPTEPALPDLSPAVVPTVFVNGPRGVGCSTASFALARRQWSAGTRTGFVDLEQLSFVRRPGATARTDVGLGLTNVATMRRFFAARGARRFVANGHLTPADGLDVLRSDPAVAVVRLASTTDTLREHLVARLGGDEARLASDDLAAATGSWREHVLQDALAQQSALVASPSTDLVVDVSERTVDSVVHELADRVGAKLGDTAPW